MIASTNSYARLEVGLNFYGLRNRIAEDPRGNDVIWVIVDKFTKVARFVLMKNTWGAKQ